jgi:outer membrane protein OmpA-like peptidoglycan-associated protein
LFRKFARNRNAIRIAASFLIVLNMSMLTGCEKRQPDASLDSKALAATAAPQLDLRYGLYYKAPNLSDVLLFEGGSVGLTEDQHHLIYRWAEDLRTKSPGAIVELSSHTDVPGSDVLRRGISRRRAELVAATLAENGIPTENIHMRILGNESPATLEKDDAGTNKDNRIVLKILSGRNIFAPELCPGDTASSCN